MKLLKYESGFVFRQVTLSRWVAENLITLFKMNVIERNTQVAIIVFTKLLDHNVVYRKTHGQGAAYVRKIIPPG